MLRSWKGRGAILCETKSGIKILKEYKGNSQRLLLQKRVLDAVRKNGYLQVEDILASKEGELLVKDDEQTAYYLKDYLQGKECSGRELADCEGAMKQLAAYHLAADLPEFARENGVEEFSLLREMEKHNRELKKVRKYLKDKGQKSTFELMLFHYYDFFQDKAIRVAQQKGKQDSRCAGEGSRKIICHGDFHHHNLLFSADRSLLVNFEKFSFDQSTRDIALFFRKIMEKNGWSVHWGAQLLRAYESTRLLSAEERLDLYYRLSYPEKFWKIVNFYYNSSKSWIPGKNLEKLEKLLKQEEEKKHYLEEYFLPWVLG